MNTNKIGRFFGLSCAMPVVRYPERDLFHPIPVKIFLIFSPNTSCCDAVLRLCWVRCLPMRDLVPR